MATLTLVFASYRYTALATWEFPDFFNLGRGNVGGENR